MPKALHTKYLDLQSKGCMGNSSGLLGGPGIFSLARLAFLRLEICGKPDFVLPQA